MWNVFIIVTWILKSHEYQTELASLLNIHDIISKYVTPCLVNILNDTAVSMACSTEPSMEEARMLIYQHMCRPQHIRAIKVGCNPVNKRQENLKHMYDIFTKKEDHDCWHAEVHFEQQNGWSTFSNIRVFSNPMCDMTKVKLQTLHPHSFELIGINISELDFGRLRQASIIVLHNSLTTPPSLLDLVKLHSLRLLSLRNHQFASVLQQWKHESSFIQSPPKSQIYLMELLDLEIIGSSIVHIPDRIFTIISVKVSLSLCNNIIQTISGKTFLGLTSLRALYLNDNIISHIHKTAFKTLTNLNTILLMGNQIQFLDENIFINMNGDLPFESEIIIGHKTVATGYKTMNNIIILMNNISYGGYVKHLYVNKHEIKYSATFRDYYRLHDILTLRSHLYSYLSIYLYGNPLVQSLRPCFLVNAVQVNSVANTITSMPCFCNIGNSNRTTDYTLQVLNTSVIYKSGVKQMIYMNESKCESGNMKTPGMIDLRFHNITNISILQMFHKELVSSTYIAINLSYNKINVLAPSNTWLPHHPDTNLSKTLHVAEIILSHNGLTNILPGAWLNVVFDKIHIYNNNLIVITNQTFGNLDTKYLSLQHNRIQHITKMGFRNIKNIKVLILSNNMILQLYSRPFPLTLIQLYLSNTNLTNVHFYYQYIQYVNFSFSRLTFLHRITNRSHTMMVSLNFHGNLITDIKEKTFLSYAKIDQLDLSMNYFDLNFTKIYFNKYFKCSLLNLTNNHITSVTDLFYHAGFRRILELDLSHNYITEVQDLNNHHHQITLRKLHMAYNKITYISPNIFQNMVQLIYADFKGNKLHYFYLMPAIYQEFVVDFTHNPLHCSCHLRWLHEKTLWYKYKTDICIDLVSLRHVRVIDVPLEDFVCETPCTTGQCDCYGPHANHSSLTTHVTCSGRGLTEVPHPLPPLIQVLDISHNYIQNINTFTLTKYSHLRKIILSYNLIPLLMLNYCNVLSKLKTLMLDHNQLEYITFNQELKMQSLEELYLNNNNLRYIEFSGKLSNSLPRLQKLDIRNNKLPYINRSLCQDLTNLHDLVSIKLLGNDWNCQSCNALHFRLCISHNYEFYTKMSDMEKWRCVSGYSDMPILSVAWSNDVCVISSEETTHTFSTKHIVLIVLNVILGTVAVFMCPCLVFRIRYAKHFRVIFQHMSVVFHKDNTLHSLPHDQYDANLVYDSEDEQVRHWVVQTLLEGLEQDHGYKIMIEERDGPVGCPLAEANYLAIRDSQRTIVVLSQHFDRDKWKQDAVDQAFLCWKNHNKKHKVIFVAYDIILEVEELQNELRVLACMGYYLPCLWIDRHDRTFWRKLRQKMPRHTNR